MAFSTAVKQNGAAPSRMTLAAVHKGTRKAPDKILLVGVEGVGKSTWGSDASAPIFLAAEDGIHHLDVASFPEPHTFPEVLDAIRVLCTDPHDYKTLVIDTVDWLEPILQRSVCEANGWANIEAPGYGKGYTVVLDEWRKLIFALDHLRTKRGMEVILLAHAAIRNFANPAGNDYMRYSPKLNDRAGALLKEWADSILFATFEEYAPKVKGELRVKGVYTGRRVVHTQRTAAWDAKSRHSIPAELPLSYADYAAARDAGQTASPVDLEGEALVLLSEPVFSAEERAKINAHIEASRGNATKLAKAVDRLRSLIAERGGADV
jgi:hypothetical protein